MKKLSLELIGKGFKTALRRGRIQNGLKCSEAGGKDEKPATTDPYLAKKSLIEEFRNSSDQ